MIIFPGIRVWDVVSELVCLCTVPSPSNPFALDTRYIKSLPLPDRFLVTGALLNFLEMYVVYGNRDELHYDKGRKCWSAAGGVCFFGGFFLWCCHRLLLGVILCFAVFVTASRWCRLASFQKGVKRVFAFSSTLGCAWIFKGICERFFVFFDQFPFLSSGGGGEASEASPRTVPAGVTATPGVLRVGPQSNRAERFRRWVTAICWRLIYVVYLEMRHFCWLFGTKKKRESKSVPMCEICISVFIFIVVCLMPHITASAMTSECVYLTCRNKNV